MVDNEKLLQIATRIYQDLAADARKGKEGIFWETITIVPNENQVLKNTNETLLNGVSGILIFLTEYYELTKEPACLEKMLQTAEWLIDHCRNNKISSVGFYSGRAGVAYALMQLSSLTGNQQFLEEAENIIASCSRYIPKKKKMIPANLGNGISGTLLVQLMLFDRCKKESLLRDIEQNLNALITHLRINESGIHFDELVYSRKPLISFPEGNSGIGHVLFQLGHYFNNATAIGLAHQLFDYENACYLPVRKNWPDFTNAEFFNKNREEYVNSYKKRNKKFFDTETDTVSWYTGAPSVGFSRLTAVERGFTKYATDVNTAAEKTLDFVEHSLRSKKDNKFTLLSGLAGAGLYLLDVQRHNNNASYAPVILAIANDAIKQYEQLAYFRSDHYYATEVADITLFTGECGVGYFFIQLLKNSRGKSIVRPALDFVEKTQYTIPFELNNVYSALLQSYYSKSYELLKTLNHADKLTFEGRSLREFHTVYTNYVAGVSEGNKKLKSILDFEKTKIQLIKTNDNFHFTFVKNKSLQEEQAEFLRRTDDRTLLKSTLYLNESCKLCSYQNGDIKFLALKQIFNGVHEMPLNKFSYDIFTLFTTPQNVEKAIDQIIKSAKPKSAEESEEIRQLTLDQIRQGLKVSLLNVKKARFGWF